MRFHMTDGGVGLQQEAWLHCFTIFLKQERSTHTGALPAACVMDANSACRGYERTVEGSGGGGGLPSHKWTPETSWRGRGVANVCFGHGLCQSV